MKFTVHAQVSTWHVDGFWHMVSTHVTNTPARQNLSLPAASLCQTERILASSFSVPHSVPSPCPVSYPGSDFYQQTFVGLVRELRVNAIVLCNRHRAFLCAWLLLLTHVIVYVSGSCSLLLSALLQYFCCGIPLKERTFSLPTHSFFHPVCGFFHHIKQFWH